MKKILNASLLVMITFSIFTPATMYAARSLSTDDARVVDERHFEIENGFEYVNQTDNENNLSFVLKYGLIKNLDCGIEITYKFIDFNKGSDVDGLGDISATLKYSLSDEVDNYPALALSFSVKSKTGNKDKGLGSGEVDYSLNGIITKEINNFVGHLNFGYTFAGDPEGENVDDIFSYSIALEYPVNEKLNIVGEITGETTFDEDFDDNPCSVLTGLNYAVNEAISYDFGIGFEISEVSPDYSINTGLTFGF